MNLLLRLLCPCASFTCSSTSYMAKPRFLFSTSRPITRPYRDEDYLETPYSIAVTPTHADHLTSSDTLALTPVPAHHTIDAPSKEVYTQLNGEATQISGYPLPEEFVLPGPSTRQSRRRFWMILSLHIGVLLILAIGVGVGIPSSLHDPANVKNNSSGGVDIGGSIHILMVRDTGNSSDNGNSSSSNSGTDNGPSTPSYCITDDCPGASSPSNSSGKSDGSGSGNSNSSASGNSSGSSNGSGNSSSGDHGSSSNRSTGSVTLAMVVTAAAFLSVW
ncbi:hypothetical protein BC827DRAFT_200047 [Russula dissimulans]|nr:hypothetical protein BC827DRAFT_200047 [Russula dissimulans]